MDYKKDLDKLVDALRGRMRADHGNNAVLIVDVIVLMKSAIMHASYDDYDGAQDHVFQVLQIMLIALGLESDAESVAKYGREFEELLVSHGAAGRGPRDPRVTVQ